MTEEVKTPTKDDLLKDRLRLCAQLGDIRFQILALGHHETDLSQKISNVNSQLIEMEKEGSKDGSSN